MPLMPHRQHLRLFNLLKLTKYKMDQHMTHPRVPYAHTVAMLRALVGRNAGDSMDHGASYIWLSCLHLSAAVGRVQAHVSVA
jgi:hypothetical protein